MQIDATARIEEGARIGKGAVIGPYCLIGQNVVIGEDCQPDRQRSCFGTNDDRRADRRPPFRLPRRAAPIVRLQRRTDGVSIGADCTIRESVTMSRGTAEGGGETVGRGRRVLHGLQPCRARLPHRSPGHLRQLRHARRPLRARRQCLPFWPSPGASIHSDRFRSDDRRRRRESAATSSRSVSRWASRRA